MIVCRAWDIAASTAATADYTAGVKLGRLSDGSYVVLDAIRVKFTPLERDRAILSAAQQDGKLCRVILEQQAGAAGIDMKQHYAKVLAGFDVVHAKPSGDKAHRAAPLASAAEAGIVALVRGPWNIDFLNELESFPEGLHDDYTDAASYAFNELAKHRITNNEKPDSRN